jgi:hypothetical protein
VSKVLVADGRTTVAYVYGGGALGEAALTPGTNYYFYAVAQDSAGNASAVLSVSVSTASNGYAGTRDVLQGLGAAAMATGNGMFVKYVVPAGAQQLELFCFGAGQETQFVTGSAPGAGGFSYGRILVSGGSSLAIVTGANVLPSATDATTYQAYKDIAANYGYNSSTNYGIKHGFSYGSALAGVFEVFDPVTTAMSALQSKAIILAGGAGDRDGGYTHAYGGGSTGANGVSWHGTWSTGGSQTAAGTGHANGYYLYGPQGYVGDWGGGGGGGGYWAGGSGRKFNEGAGGSGFVGGTVAHAVTGGYTQQGIPTLAPAGVVGSANAAAAFAAFWANPDRNKGAVYVFASSAASVRFAYTGADQTLAIPAGVSSVRVSAWGGGGASGKNPGLGGFSESTIALAAGTSYLKVIVGSNGIWGSTTGVYGGGGAAGNATYKAGCGAGRSAVRLPDGTVDYCSATQHSP